MVAVFYACMYMCMFVYPCLCVSRSAGAPEASERAEGSCLVFALSEMVGGNARGLALHLHATNPPPIKLMGYSLYTLMEGHVTLRGNVETGQDRIRVYVHMHACIHVMYIRTIISPGIYFLTCMLEIRDHGVYWRQVFIS